MKKAILIVSILLICIFNTSAHEEPAKTLKEKQKKEEERQKILKNKTSTVVMWKHTIEKGKYLHDKKEKYIETVYSDQGNLEQMKVYKNGDSLEYKVVFSYDENNNMLTDTDYNPDGSIYEKIEYELDNTGRVKAQTNYTKTGTIDSKFTYNINYEKKILLFEKFKPLDSVEYQMVYKYDGNPDESNNIEIIKQTTDGDQLMRVENVFNESGLRTHKKIFDENNELMYYFEYNYDEKTGNNLIIEKKSPENTVLAKTVYTYNQDDQVVSVSAYNEEQILISYVSYTYK